MAPSSWGTGDGNSMTITGNETFASGTSYIGGIYYDVKSYTTYTKKKETKKERILRISKEKMMASRIVYNQKSSTVRSVVQVAKPRYRRVQYR